MEAERWNRIEELFHRVVDLPPSEREGVLSSSGADAETRAEVERLLESDARADEEPDAFLRVETHVRPPPPDPYLGRTLGAYRLSERLAAGGMGVVYRAERVDGLFQQEVAIKLIRAESTNEWMLRRFEFERRTLAGLQHPCIAKLLDGGTTAEGNPYFVMEYVRGEPIDRYAERHRLTLTARLELLVEVCRAVQYAHQNLVVHCDLKPANILIDSEGRPHLLDFGIARLLEQAPLQNAVDDGAEPGSGGPRTLARILTPEYASPEQLSGGALTTAVDVYSLGVLLYELLTGRRPFQSASRSPSEWERMVLEQDPERPSTRVLRLADGRPAAELARSLRSTPAGLRRALRGDLDRIVLMALRKEPERRYPSVQELADDLERHERGRPVRARSDSLAYVAGKFVRRNRVVVGASVAVLVALLAGLIAARSSQRVAESEAEHSRMEADSFQSIADFLMDAFLPVQTDPDPVWLARARARIQAHAERVHRQYAGQDHVRANLLDELGQVCLRLGLIEDARPLMRDSAAIRERAFGLDSLEYAISLRSQGQLAYTCGDYAGAVGLLQRALAIHRAAGRSTHADVSALANDLAACLRNLGRDEEAEALHREALELRRTLDEGSLPVAESLNNLAVLHMARGQNDRALGELEEALAIREHILGEVHVLSLQTLSNLAAARWNRGEAGQAKELFRRAEAGYRSLGVDGEEGLSSVLSSLATILQAEGDLRGADASLEEALELKRRRLGDDHPQLVETLTTRAVLHHALGREAEARDSWEELLRILHDSGAPAGNLVKGLYGYGVFLCDIAEFGDARALFEEAAELVRAQQPAESLVLARVEEALARSLQGMDDREGARAHLEECLRILRADPEATPRELENVQRKLEALAPVR